MNFFRQLQIAIYQFAIPSKKLNHCSNGTAQANPLSIIRHLKSSALAAQSSIAEALPKDLPIIHRGPVNFIFDIYARTKSIMPRQSFIIDVTDGLPVDLPYPR